MVKKIAVIGAHCTGKTTICNKLVLYLQARGLKVTQITEMARKFPFPVNEESTLKAQEWILPHQIREENNSADFDVVVCDRSVLDNYAYLYRANGKQHHELKDLMLTHLKGYDLLLVTKIKEEPMLADGFRSTNSEFRQEIEELVYSMVNEFRANLIANDVRVLKVNNFEDAKTGFDKFCGNKI